LKGEALSRRLDFWRSHLAGAPTVLDLRPDHPRPQMQTFDGATLRRSFPAELSRRVRERSQHEQVTPYMLLLAAFATLLYRRTGRDDMLFGGPMAGRQEPEYEDLIGFFANTVAVRVRMEGNPTFSELLRRVRDSVLSSYDHQDVPFDLVVDAVRPQRDPAINPLVQVNFRVRVGEPAGLELPDTRTEPLAVDLGVARFDLALELHVLDDGLEAEFNWNTALFEPRTIERLAAVFEALLTQALSDPRTRLLSFSLDTPSAEEAVAELAGGPSASIRGFRGAGARTGSRIRGG
jgi:non-ribosomal peptide synthetase component F